MFKPPWVVGNGSLSKRLTQIFDPLLILMLLIMFPQISKYDESLRNRYAHSEMAAITTSWGAVKFLFSEGWQPGEKIAIKICQGVEGKPLQFDRIENDSGRRLNVWMKFIEIFHFRPEVSSCYIDPVYRILRLIAEKAGLSRI